MTDEHECSCEHPFRIGEFLNLCGSEMCKQFKRKAYRNGYDRERGCIIIEVPEE